MNKVFSYYSTMRARRAMQYTQGEQERDVGDERPQGRREATYDEDFGALRSMAHGDQLGSAAFFSLYKLSSIIKIISEKCSVCDVELKGLHLAR